MNETDKTLLERAARAGGKRPDEISVFYMDGKFDSLNILSHAAELALLRNIDVVWLNGAVKANKWYEHYTDPASKRLAYCRAVTRAAAALWEGK